MLWTLAIVLFVLWIFLVAMHVVASALIHLLLVAAIIVVVFRLLSGRRV